MRKVVGHAIAASVLAVAATGAFGVAPAEASVAQCRSGNVCFWRDAGYADPQNPGQFANTSRGRHTLSGYSHTSCNNGANWDKCITSLYNFNSTCWHTFLSTNESGGYHNLSAGGTVDLSTAWPGFNDAIRNLYNTGTAAC
jgi:hypothetical protein